MGTGQYSKLKPDVAGFAREKITSYNPANKFNNGAFRACGFSRFKAGQDVLVSDLMSGPGKFGKEVIEAKYKVHPNFKATLHLVINDARDEPLALLRQEGYETLLADVRRLPATYSFDIAGVRYGLKDLPRDQIPVALESIRGTLKKGGRIVIADMFAYSAAGQEGVIEVHSLKQYLAGRNERKEGICHIPRKHEWLGMLRAAGFRVSVIEAISTSDVDTRNWKGQFGPKANDNEMIYKMNEEIMAVSKRNPGFANEFQVTYSHTQEEGHVVKLKFPILVIKAELR